MTPDELRALADALEPMAKAPRFEDLDVPGFCAWVRACADAQPAVAWMALAYGLPSQATTDEPTAIRWRKAGGDVVPLYTHPAPQPQPERQPVSEPRPARLFIDGEWNSYGGELISIALAAEDGREFYAVLGCDNPEPWVAENVIPKLGVSRDESIESAQVRLKLFLMQFSAVHIVADWPEDIERFCRLLITGPGTRIDTPPLTMEVVRIDAPSENPHNALADARGLRAALAARETK